MKNTQTSFSIPTIGILFALGCLCAAFMPLAIFLGPIGLVARMAS